MNSRSIVSHSLSGKLCNNVLQTYRTFWFAYTHGIPFSNVVVGTGTYAPHHIFDKVRWHIIPDYDYGRIKFDIVYNCAPRTRNIRQELFDLQPRDGENVTFEHGSFIYPELPWEHALFATLFDNRYMRSLILERYGDVLCGNTVGYTIRRTDTLNRRECLTLTPEFVVNDFRTIIARHSGMVRILVASDDLVFVDNIVKSNSDIAKHIYVIRAAEDITLYLLSMCDYVFNNSQMQCTCSWLNNPHSQWESTFGQVAQILNRSYKYVEFATKRMDPELNEPGCDLGKIDVAEFDAVTDAVRSDERCRVGSEWGYPALIPPVAARP